MPIEPPMSSRRIARAAAQARHLRQLGGNQPAVDIDHGHRRRWLDPKLAALEADDAGSRLVQEIVPAADGAERGASASERRRGCGAASVRRASARFQARCRRAPRA